MANQKTNRWVRSQLKEIREQMKRLLCVITEATEFRDKHSYRCLTNQERKYRTRTVYFELQELRKSVEEHYVRDGLSDGYSEWDELDEKEYGEPKY
jgi:hypothetical protein